MDPTLSSMGTPETLYVLGICSEETPCNPTSLISASLDSTTYPRNYSGFFPIYHIMINKNALIYSNYTYGFPIDIFTFICNEKKKDFDCDFSYKSTFLENFKFIINNSFINETQLNLNEKVSILLAVRFLSLKVHYLSELVEYNIGVIAYVFVSDLTNIFQNVLRNLLDRIIKNAIIGIIIIILLSIFLIALGSAMSEVITSPISELIGKLKQVRNGLKINIFLDKKDANSSQDVQFLYKVSQTLSMTYFFSKNTFQNMNENMALLDYAESYQLFKDSKNERAMGLCLNNMKNKIGRAHV